jgi:hypothetical protein
MARPTIYILPIEARQTGSWECRVQMEFMLRLSGLRLRLFNYVQGGDTTYIAVTTPGTSNKISWPESKKEWGK